MAQNEENQGFFPSPVVILRTPPIKKYREDDEISFSQ